MPNTRRTALHVAARFGNAECIPVLVRFGANIDTEDKDGKTALELAVWKKHCLAAQELEKMGANKKGLTASPCFEGMKNSYFKNWSMRFDDINQIFQFQF